MRAAAPTAASAARALTPRAAAPFVVVPVVVVAAAVPDVVADEPPDVAGEVAEEAALVALEVALAVRVTPCVRTINVREGFERWGRKGRTTARQSCWAADSAAVRSLPVHEDWMHCVVLEMKAWLWHRQLLSVLEHPPRSAFSMHVSAQSKRERGN